MAEYLTIDKDYNFTEELLKAKELYEKNSCLDPMNEILYKRFQPQQKILAELYAEKFNVKSEFLNFGYKCYLNLTPSGNYHIWVYKL